MAYRVMFQMELHVVMFPQCWSLQEWCTQKKLMHQNLPTLVQLMWVCPLGGHPVVKYRGCVHLMWRKNELKTLNSCSQSSIPQKTQKSGLQPCMTLIWVRSDRLRATKMKQIIHRHTAMMHAHLCSAATPVACLWT